MDNHKEIIKNFKGKNILIVGDIVLDRYIFGEVKRISPEAPIPIIEVNNIAIRYFLLVSIPYTNHCDLLIKGGFLFINFSILTTVK